jgi:anthranilate synthase component 2
MQLIKTFVGVKPILGVCLGHQALAMHFGAKLLNLPAVFHGISLPTNIINEGILFKNMPQVIDTGHYHSWVVDEVNFPQDLKITASTKQKYIMAFEHQNQAVCGVQFHPESVLTPLGDKILANWVNENITQN